MEKTVTLRGLVYPWIYRPPAADWTLSLQDELGPVGRTGLLGYRLSRNTLHSGQTLTVTLYRQHQSASAAQWMVEAQGTGGRSDGRPQTSAAGGSPVERGAIIEEVYHVDVDSTPEPKTYQVRIGLQREADGAVEWLSFPTPPTVHFVAK